MSQLVALGSCDLCPVSPRAGGAPRAWAGQSSGPLHVPPLPTCGPGRPRAAWPLTPSTCGLCWSVVGSGFLREATSSQPQRGPMPSSQRAPTGHGKVSLPQRRRIAECIWRRVQAGPGDEGTGLGCPQERKMTGEAGGGLKSELRIHWLPSPLLWMSAPLGPEA